MFSENGKQCGDVQNVLPIFEKFPLKREETESAGGRVKRKKESERRREERGRDEERERERAETERELGFRV